MISKLYFKDVDSGSTRRLCLLLSGLLVLTASGCGPEKSDGTVINDESETELPTDLLLGLQCEDVGIFDEPCVLEDNNNPFRTTAIIEFDVNGPEDQETKFDQAEELIPDDVPGVPGVTGVSYAKSRFYFWATALARRPDVGENQFLTAVALHDLYTAGGGVNGGSQTALEQARKAYQSLLDNYFGAAIFIEQDDPDSDDPDDTVVFPIDLSQLTAVELVTPRTRDTLFPGDDPRLNAIVELGDWGYTYVPPPAGVPGEPEPLPTLIPINFVPIQF